MFLLLLNKKNFIFAEIERAGRLRLVCVVWLYLVLVWGVFVSRRGCKKISC